MLKALRPYVTPATAALFIVSALSGAALFFHLGGGFFHEMHEWLSMVLLVPAALHLQRNWNGFVAYLRRGGLLVPSALTVAAAAGFLLASSGGEGRPPSPAAQLVATAPVSTLATLLKADTASVMSRLQARGYAVRSPNESVGEVAAAANVSTEQLVRELAPAAPAPDPDQDGD